MALADLAGEDFCYLTTTGRVSGKPRQIEIWFGLEGNTLYMLSGGRDRSNWVRNILKEPSVSVRIGRRRFKGEGRIVKARSKEDRLARRLLLEKYADSDDDLSGWGRTALPVAVDLSVPN